MFDGSSSADPDEADFFVVMLTSSDVKSALSAAHYCAGFPDSRRRQIFKPSSFYFHKVNALWIDGLSSNALLFNQEALSTTSSQAL